MDKLEAWRLADDPEIEYGLFTSPEVERNDDVGYVRVYVIDADEEDRKRCETCKTFHESKRFLKPNYCKAWAVQGPNALRIYTTKQDANHYANCCREGGWKVDEPQEVLLVDPVARIAELEQFNLGLAEESHRLQDELERAKAELTQLRADIAVRDADIRELRAEVGRLKHRRCPLCLQRPDGSVDNG